MPRGTKKQSTHTITPDLILQLYKETKTMPEAERNKVLDKLKELVKYIGKEMIVDL